MIIPDINVLVYAHRDESPQHARYRGWLIAAARGADRLAIPGHVASGFVRIATHPGILRPPTDTTAAVDFIETLLGYSQVIVPALSQSHVGVFLDLCERFGIKGKSASDAYLAAIAIDLNAELITADRGFARFSGLRWRHPFDA